MWIGERAFRATVASKEQIEAFGFLLKIYRNSEKCCRALDKKSNVAPTATFIVSEADVEPMLAYLCSRGASNLRIVVDASVVSQVDVQMLVSRLAWPQDSTVIVASCWEDVLAALRNISEEASVLFAAGPSQKSRGTTSYECAQPAEVKVDPKEATAAVGSTDPCSASEVPWTLVWVSDQAFKPSAFPQKARLESLGCTVKGYKTNKNAARALDKKRALARAVFLVSGVEAAPFLAYLGSRPELAATPVVVEANAQAVPVREGPLCRVVNGFEEAVDAIIEIVAESEFA